jgi:putative peptidoglycan lipid II flippase
MNRGILVKTSFLLIVLTLGEKLVGFVRDQAIAYFYGASPETDAFYVALTLAMGLVSVIGGVFSTALIPVLTGLWEKSRGTGWRVAASIAPTYIAISLCVGIAVILGAPWLLVHVLAPGLPVSTRPLAVELVRALGFGFLFWAMASLFAGVLNSRKSFVIPALGPIALNVTTLVVLLAGNHRSGIKALAAGTVLGMTAQFLIQVPSVVRAWSREHSLPTEAMGAEKAVWTLVGPILAVSVVSQVAPIVDKAIASGLVAGSVSILAFAQKLMQLPIGLFVGAVATVFYTSLSAAWAQGDAGTAADELGLAMGVTLLLTVPAAVGIAELGRPLVQFVFQHGQFTAAAAGLTSVALAYYCLGLPLVAVDYVLIRNAFAAKDTRSPLVSYIGAVAVNAIGDWALSRTMGVPGIALAGSLGAATLAFSLMAAWTPDFRAAVARSLMASMGTVLVASGIMGIIIFAVASRVTHGPIWIRLGIPGVCGIVVYAAMLFVRPPREIGLLTARAKIPGQA